MNQNPNKCSANQEKKIQIFIGTLGLGSYSPKSKSLINKWPIINNM